MSAYLPPIAGPVKVQGRISNKKNTGPRLFKIIIVTVLLLALFACGYWVYQNKERLLFYIQKDKYSKIEQDIDRLIALTGKIRINISGTDQSEIRKDLLILSDDLLNRIGNLQKDHPEDGFLYFLQGKINYHLFQTWSESDVNHKTNLIFEIYINRYRFPATVENDLFYKAILSLRKALILKVNTNYSLQAVNWLIDLYFWGGLPYWHSGFTVAKNEKITDNITLNSFNVLFAEKMPAWDTLQKSMPSQNVDLLKGIYYLKTGNSPVGFSLLNSLIDQNENIPVKNNALYLMGELIGRKNRNRKQLFYYDKIDLQEFIAREPWFLEEYHFLLRFLGENQKAVELLNTFEKKKNPD